MEGGVDFAPKIERPTNTTPENRFKNLAQNTGGILLTVENPDIIGVIPYVINYRPGQPAPDGAVRVYRGVDYIPAHKCPQIPSILKRAENIDDELMGLVSELADHPSPEVYKKIKTKNIFLGNSNYFIDKAEEHIKEVMSENGGDYLDAFKSMHRWENTASPFVSTSDRLDQAFGYSMRGRLPGMVIVADIPESLISYDFMTGFDKEIAIKGIIKQEYFKSIFMVTGRHEIQDEHFFRSAQELIK